MIYNSKYCAEIFKLMAAGFTDTQVYAKWGICKDTFYKWKRERPEFLEAHQQGSAQYEAYLDAKGRAGMLKEEDIDFQFWKELCKYKLGRSDKATPTTVTNNTLILQNQSNDDLIEFIKNNLEQVPELSHIIEHNDE